MALLEVTLLWIFFAWWKFLAMCALVILVAFFVLLTRGPKMWLWPVWLRTPTKWLVAILVLPPLNGVRGTFGDWGDYRGRVNNWSLPAALGESSRNRVDRW